MGVLDDIADRLQRVYKSMEKKGRTSGIPNSIPPYETSDLIDFARHLPRGRHDEAVVTHSFFANYQFSPESLCTLYEFLGSRTRIGRRVEYSGLLGSFGLEDEVGPLAELFHKQVFEDFDNLLANLGNATLYMHTNSRFLFSQKEDGNLAFDRVAGGWEGFLENLKADLYQQRSMPTASPCQPPSEGSIYDRLVRSGGPLHLAPKYRQGN